MKISRGCESRPDIISYPDLTVMQRKNAGDLGARLTNILVGLQIFELPLNF